MLRDPYDPKWNGRIPPDDDSTRWSFFGLLSMVFIIILYFTGCVHAPVNIPGSCPKLKMPPIPQQVNLHINGDLIEADDGGKLLLQGYSRSRALLR